VAKYKTPLVEFFSSNNNIDLDIVYMDMNIVNIDMNIIYINIEEKREF
jgi:hypothetical protein